MPESGAAFRERLAVLRREYVRQLPEKVLQIQAALQLVLQGDAGGYLRLYQIAHSLTGSSATFGLPDLSRAARALEHAVRPFAVDSTLAQPGAPAELASLLETLRSAVPSNAGAVRDDAVVTCAGADPKSPVGRLIHLIGADRVLAEYLDEQLGHLGYTMRAFDRCAEAAGSGEDGVPAALIVDQSNFNDEDFGASKEALGWGRGESCPPLIFLSSRGDFCSRLAAVRAGGDAYVTKPVEIGALVGVLDALAGKAKRDPPRVLIVEDCAALADIYAQTLRQAGMATKTVTDPLSIMDALSDFSPELMLVDMYMPGASGEEIVGVLRQQDEFAGIPIVLLSAETDLREQRAAVRLGVDEFLVKPIQSEHLVFAVNSRIERYRVLRSFMIRDSLTGFLSHTGIKEHLEIEVARAQRQGRPVSFGILNLDRFRCVNDSYGHAVGDRVLKSVARLLRQRLRKIDITGRYGGEAFAVVLADTGGGDAFRVLDAIRRDVADIRLSAEGAEFSVTFSCGVASFPDFVTPREIGDAAERALAQAKRDGRDRVVLA